MPHIVLLSVCSFSLHATYKHKLQNDGIVCVLLTQRFHNSVGTISTPIVHTLYVHTFMFRVTLAVTIWYVLCKLFNTSEPVV